MKPLALLAALSLAASKAQAADIRWGLLAGPSLPQGKVADEGHLDGKMGFTLGITLQVDLGKGHAVVPRLDSSSYTRSESGFDDVYGVQVEYGHSINTVSIGADYNYYPAGKVGQGLYVLGGLGFARVKHELKYGFLSYSDTPSALQFALGAGYGFASNWHGELRFTSVKVESEFRDQFFYMKESIACQAIHVTVGYRF